MLSFNMGHLDRTRQKSVRDSQRAPAGDDSSRVHPAVRRLWAASVTESLGDDISRSLLPIVAVVELGSGALAVSLLGAVGTAAFALAGTWTGALVDQLPKRWVLCSADLVRALALAVLPVGYVFHFLALWELFVAAAVVGLADVFFSSAQAAVIPTVVRLDQVGATYAKLATIQNVVRMVSPGLASGLIRIMSAPLAMIAACLGYAASAVLFLLHGWSEPTRKPHSASTLQRAREGVSFALKEPRLRAMLLSGMFLNGGTMMGGVLLVVYALGSLQLSPAFVALLPALSAAGGTLGSVLASRVARRIGIGRGRVYVPALILPAAALAPLAPALPWPPQASLAACELTLAALTTISSIIGAEVLPALTPVDRLASVTASSRVFIVGVIPVASLLGGLLSGAIGVQGVLWLGGAIAAASALPIAASEIAGWRVVPAQAHASADAGQVATNRSGSAT